MVSKNAIIDLNVLPKTKFGVGKSYILGKAAFI